MIPVQKQKQQVTEMVNQYGWDAQAAVPGLRINPYENIASELTGHCAMYGEIGVDGSETKVVVKPHNNYDRALREMNISSKLGRLGLNVPEQLGLYRGQQASYLVSRRYSGLQTLAEIDWGEPLASPVYSAKLPQVRRAAVGLAKFQAVNAVHMDFLDRNAAEGPSAEPVFIDLERAQVDSNYVTPISRAQDAYRLVGSLVNHGFYSSHQPSYRFGALKEHILNPYQLASVKEVDFDLLDAAVGAAAFARMTASKITAAADFYTKNILRRKKIS